VKDLIMTLSRAYISEKSEIRVPADLEKINLDLKRTVRLGLILNGLITSAFRYTYSESGREINVKIKKSGEK
jgi:two-component sensor histidine kinase